MYSYEILKLLKRKKYLLTLDDYLKIIENPQVREVYYKDNKFYLITDDNYSFTFKIIDEK